MTKNKNYIIKFRCSQEEKLSILKKAQKAGINTSEYCRLQALNGIVNSRPELSLQEIGFFEALVFHNKNFSLISNLLKNKDPHFVKAIFEHLMKMKTLYSKFFPE